MEPLVAKSDLAGYLRAHGVTPTRQRLIISEALFDKRQHVSAEQILARVAQKDKSVSRATVYNTLNLFVDKKLIKALVIDKSKVFYDTNVSSHHHVYNVDTGEVVDVCPDHVVISELPPLPPGLELEGTDVVIRVRKASFA
jgi:Fur family iron response transcriptional regulator